MAGISAESHGRVPNSFHFLRPILWPSLFVALVLVSPLGTPVSATMLEQVGYAASAAHAIKAASDTLGETGVGGVFIKSLHGRGCLDSGCCSIDWTQQLRLNANCPTWGWLKWSSDGPLIVSHRPFLRGCLQCDNAEPGCVAQVSRCSGRFDQQWRLKFAANWTTGFNEPLFAIASFFSPDRCLTLVNGGGDGDFYALRGCATPRPSEWQSFYVVRNPLKR
uniref:Putative secreted protein n=1 Tax=Amblyomma triste TaxID=251400 RepID=A0A023G5L4_AMBTT